ncbi:TauD/TfdA dioxygenase family protein [Sphingorhabdus sp.]|uniref:TauD/TfdA dioxygenase family protein n=1 Tax=Sphingorhabdus sp. TaxID=1902408 RepID=UPI0035B320C5
MSINVQNITPVIGAEVSGIDLTQIDEVTAASLRRLLADRGVLVFRDQQLDHAAHKRAAACFGTGELHYHPLATASGSADPAVLTVKATANSTYAAGDGWHTDVSCDPAPIRASLLYMHEMPESGGGDTVFASMTEAYALLSEPVQDLIGNLRAVHDGALPWRQAYGKEPAAGTEYNRTVHPMVIAHPDNGKPLLWVNRGFTTKIQGVTALESRALLEMLFQHIESTPRIQCRVRWDKHTLVIWDNIATQHHAVWDYFPHTRHAERVSVIGGELQAA